MSMYHCPRLFNLTTLPIALLITAAVHAQVPVAQEAPSDQAVSFDPEPQGLARPPTDVLFTNIAGDATAEVPGLPGVEFQPGITSAIFDRIYGSPNGNWIMRARSEPLAGQDVVLVNGTFAIREGAPAPWLGGAETIATIQNTLSINDQGNWAMVARTNGPSPSDQHMVRVQGGAFASVAQEGQAVLPLPGVSWGATILDPAITADGRVALRARALVGTAVGQEEILLRGVEVLAQSGITVPPGQLGNESISDLINFFLSADGSTWLAVANLNGDPASSEVVLVNGNTVVQEGVILPGSAFTEPVATNGIRGENVDTAGNWYVRGFNAGAGQDWIYRNGEVFATLGDPVIAGSTEVWSDAEYAPGFFLHTGNRRGDVVIGGVSDGPASSNGLLVANNQVIVAREGDPVDLNNNGLEDDNLFIDIFWNDAGYLSDAGLFHFTVRLKDGTGDLVAVAVLRADLRDALGIDELFSDRFERTTGTPTKSLD